jgi:hypothetical protein
MDSGNNYQLQLPLFQQYYDALTEGVDSDSQYANLLDFNDSISNNPYFFHSAFAGVFVSPAGYSFPVRMMANHSDQFPRGSLSKEQLMSFFAISGESGSFTYTAGHERIPDNWYKRAIDDKFNYRDYLADILNYADRYPPLLDVGGNTGKVNTFTPVDLSSLTLGVYNAANLFQGNNLQYYAHQITQDTLPDVLYSSATNLFNILDPLISAISRGVVALACPQLAGVDERQLATFQVTTTAPMDVRTIGLLVKQLDMVAIPKNVDLFICISSCSHISPLRVRNRFILPCSENLEM